MTPPRRTWFALLALVLAAPPALAQRGSALTLAEALETARQNQPALDVARADTAAAEAQARGRRAGLLPQVSGAASYSRQTANPIGAALPGGAAEPSPDTVNYFSFGANASLRLWDFGATWGRYRAAQIGADAQRQAEAARQNAVLLAVRVAFFDAVALKALVAVVREDLAAQERHLEQVSGFVAAGARPEIDLAQVRADVANARLALVRAESAYAASKADLNRAMGVARATDYDVADEELAPLAEEGAAEDRLVAIAVEARPEIAALERRAEALRRQIKATRGDYWPVLGLSTGISDQGTDLQDLAWNWNVTAALTWPLYQGGATRAAVDELEAQLRATTAEIDDLRLAVRLEVVRARLEVEGAKAAVTAAAALVEAARETLRLAEGRYAAGAGSIIELEDAQTALTNAQGQAIQAAYGLSLARARLLAALGRG